MNPWLILWSPVGDRVEKSVPNLVAAILPNQTGEPEVMRTMLLLHTNYSARCADSEGVYVSEQLRFAKRDYPYKAVRHFFPEITCGSNPSLVARQVFNLKVTEDEEFFEMLEWEEQIYPSIRPKCDMVAQLDAVKPFKRRQMLYSKKTNTIVRVGSLVPLVKKKR